jgi:antitoxin (DNA-binding transcriptional repressor) of toxin-antitoxin stability system
MHSITVEEAQNHLAEIVEKLAPGEEVTLTRDDQPVAIIRATALQPPQMPRQLGTLKGTVCISPLTSMRSLKDLRSTSNKTLALSAVWYHDLGTVEQFN